MKQVPMVGLEGDVGHRFMVNEALDWVKKVRYDKGFMFLHGL
jgi:hypothetical protein